MAYDVVVLGGGTGGYSTALRAAQLGKQVALVERDDRLGGTCLLRGCIPTKALLRSAEVLDTVERSAEWGVRASGAPDREGMLSFKEAIVERLVTGLTHLIKSRKIDVFHSSGRLVPGPAIDLGGTILEAADVVLASGSRPKVLPGFETSERIFTSDQALALPSLPSAVVVIGAGAIGLEFASFYRSMGAEVTVIEALQRIAPLEDEEISKTLARSLKKRGIATHAGASVVSAVETENHVEVAFETSAGQQSAVAEVCLVAVGRGPVSEGMGYEESGVEMDRGFVKVAGSLRSSVENVWAVGDVASTPLQFAHVAFAEGMAVAERIAGMEVPEIDYTGVAKVTFCSPEVASVGLTEQQARDEGFNVEVAKYQFQGLGKAQIIGEGGLAKFVADSATGRILGVHLVGPHATDLISEAMLMTNWEAVAGDVARYIHPHPTLSEALGEAALALAGRPLHG
jgi:dihydrolipoamide dehydrogenase